MPTYHCDYCGEPVSGFEGDHGMFIAQCPHCGQGYGDRETDEELRYQYDKAHEEERYEDLDRQGGPYSLYIYIPYYNHEKKKVTDVMSDRYVGTFPTMREAEAWLDTHLQMWKDARIYGRNDNRRWEDSGTWISHPNKDRDEQRRIVREFWIASGIYDVAGQDWLDKWHEITGVEA